MKSQLPYVSSEGGPILVGDSADIRHWNGSDLSFYQQACAVKEFAIKPIEFGEKIVLSWDFGGAGTAFLVKSEKTEAVFLRYWSNSELSDNAIMGLMNIGDETIATASLIVTSGNVLAIWAAEDARNILEPTTKFGHPRGLSLEGSGYLFSMGTGKYEVKSSHYFKNHIEIASLRISRLEDQTAKP